MRRIIFGLLTIAGATAAIAVGFTGAFFSDTETSTGNTFAAGAIDLKIDNESYYNGNKCAFLDEQATSSPGFYWQGEALYPVPGSPCETSFPLSDLDDGLVFFNFTDIKPDDEGEDTISIHVENDAWACMDLTLTANDDNGSTEPELAVDDQDDPQDAWDGELAQNLEFFWWADDGDNVYEVGEQVLSDGVETLYDLATSTGAFSITLADSTGNAWGGDDPLPANETVYIAKAWCFGELNMNALPDDADTGPQERPGAVDCDGTLLGNGTQTDMAQMTLAFRAEQARHNEEFRCNPPGDETATLTVNKVLFVSTAGIEVADFSLHVVGPNGDQIVSDEVPVPNLPTGSYTVYEQITGNVGGKTFTVNFSGVCSNSAQVGTSSPFTLNPNDNVTCVIQNDEIGDGFGD